MSPPPLLCGGPTAGRRVVMLSRPRRPLFALLLSAAVLVSIIDRKLRIARSRPGSLASRGGCDRRPRRHREPAGSAEEPHHRARGQASDVRPDEGVRRGGLAQPALRLLPAFFDPLPEERVQQHQRPQQRHGADGRQLREPRRSHDRLGAARPRAQARTPDRPGRSGGVHRHLHGHLEPLRDQQRVGLVRGVDDPRPRPCPRSPRRGRTATPSSAG